MVTRLNSQTTVGDVQPVGMEAQAATFRGVAQTSEEMAGIAKTMAQDIYIKEVETKAREDLRRIYQENASNPQAFEEQAKAIERGYSNKGFMLPSVKRAGREAYDKIYRGYMDKVAENHMQNLTDQYKVTNTQLLQQVMTGVSDGIKASFNKDGSINENAFTAATQEFDRAQQLITQVGPDGRFLLTPEQQVNALESNRQLMLQSAVEGMVESEGPLAVWEKWNNDQLAFRFEGDDGEFLVDFKNNMTVSQRDKMGDWILSKTKEHYSVINAANQAQDREDKRRAESLERFMIDSAADGSLSPDIVRQFKADLPPNVYDDMLKRAVTGGPQTTDRALLLRAETLIAQDRGGEAIDFLRESGDNFSTPDLQRLVAKANDTSPAGRQLKSLQRQIDATAPQNIRLANPSAILVANQNAEIEYQDAINDIRRTQEREPTSEEVRSIANSVFSRWANFTYDQAYSGLPKPIAMSSQQKINPKRITNDDFATMRKKTIQVYRERLGISSEAYATMTQEERMETLQSVPDFVEEMNLLRRYQDIAEQQRALEVVNE